MTQVIVDHVLDGVYAKLYSTVLLMWNLQYLYFCLVELFSPRNLRMSWSGSSWFLYVVKRSRLDFMIKFNEASHTRVPDTLFVSLIITTFCTRTFNRHENSITSTWFSWIPWRAKITLHPFSMHSSTSVSEKQLYSEL